MDETVGASGTLRRVTKGEVVLVELLRAALCEFTRTTNEGDHQRH